jgi:hypothetical protein
MLLLFYKNITSTFAIANNLVVPHSIVPPTDLTPYTIKHQVANQVHSLRLVASLIKFLIKQPLHAIQQSPH